MKILSRLKLIFAVILIGTLAIGTLVLFSFKNYKNESIYGDLIEDLHFKMSSDSAIRDNYFLYREERAKITWEQRFKETMILIDQTNKQLIDKEEIEIIDQIKKNVEALNRIFLRIIENTNSLNKKNINKEEFNELDKRLISQLLIKDSAILDNFETLKELKDNNEELAYRRFLFAILISTLIVGGIILPNLFWLYRLLRTRITDLISGTIAIGAGNLEQKLNEKGVDELADVARTINDMTNKMTVVNNRLNEAQSIAKIGSWHFDLKTFYVDWTKENYRIFEIEEKISQTDLFEFYQMRVHPDDKPALDHLVERASIYGEDYVINHRILLDDGKRIKHVQGIGKVTKDHLGKPISISGTCRDITAEVLKENELQSERLKSIHNSKLASLGELSAGVAHEINNPLAIISGHVKIMPKFLSDPVKLQEKIDSILKSTNRIEKIVTGLRKFSRTSDGRTFKVDSLFNILSEVNVFMEVKAKRALVPIEMKVDSKKNIFCDSLEIEQVLVNLVGNAIDAIKNVEDKWIKIHCFDENNEVVLQVIDSGAGISTEVELKLFDPFFTTKAVGEGTGLGLSISKGILDQHKASIKVNRNFSNTCFEIRFPQAEEAKSDS